MLALFSKTKKERVLSDNEMSANNNQLGKNLSENLEGKSGDNALDDQKATPYAWYGLSVLVVVYMLNFIDRNIISILAEDIKVDLDISDAQLGFLYGTAFAVFYALFGIPLGKLADNWHRIRLMTIGLVLWSSMTAFSGFAKNFAMLSVARIGVGVGEATASPAAYSLISDWFPKHMRGRALAIYSSGLYVGGGISLLIGSLVVENWNKAYPVDAPLGLAGWQAAFLAVGIPGILLGMWVLSLREPERGAIDGLKTKKTERPFKEFFQELIAIIPPLTLIGAAQAGPKSFIKNILGAIIIAIICYLFILITGNTAQWVFIGIGYYAVFSWATTLKSRDAPTFALIWANPAFLCTILGYGCVAFLSYSSSFWGAPYAIRELGIDRVDAALLLGAPSAAAGFAGVILGGWASDWLLKRNPSGRILVIAFGLLAPVPFYIITFTTQSLPLFYFAAFTSTLFASSALGAAAATTQDLVMPRMRGTATATFFISTTMVGLALGPYAAGQVSTATNSLSTGMLSIQAIAPIGAILLFIAYKLLPTAEATRNDRARAAGEDI